jgi:ABC-2 type transport system ATP-binding protein
MIDVQHFVKWYGPTRAVNDISFTIPEGKIVGFLGPNGAGKTTTIRMLTGYLPPTSGTATIAGHDILNDSVKARQSIGYLPENNPLYLDMRVEEYLHFRGKLYNMPRATRNRQIDKACDKCGLSAIRRRVIGRLSKGNRQRVGLAQALLHDPPVLILDEPTSGFDPNQITQVRQLITELRGQHTILLSSHILPEIERIADHVIIIAAGEMVAQGTPEELRRHVAGTSRIYIEARATKLAVDRELAEVPGVQSIQTQEAGEWCVIRATPQDGTDPREALGRAIANHGWAIREMHREGASLEQFFVQITARQSHVSTDSPN